MKYKSQSKQIDLNIKKNWDAVWEVINNKK